jgi:hypothetical protein
MTSACLAVLLLASPLNAQIAGRAVSAPAASPWPAALAELGPGRLRDFWGLDLTRGETLAAFARVLDRTRLRPGASPEALREGVLGYARRAARKALAEPGAVHFPGLLDLVDLGAFLPGEIRSEVQAAAARGLPDDGGGFSTAEELLRRLYPEFEGEISDFYPGEEDFSLDAYKFRNSLFSRPDLVRAWVGNLRELKAFSPKAYRKFLVEYQGGETGRVAFALPVPCFSNRARWRNILLPYPLAGARASKPVGGGEFVQVTHDALQEASAFEGIRGRHALFSEVIGANFEVLQTMASLAESFDPPAARLILRQARRLVDAYAEFEKAFHYTRFLQTEAAFKKISAGVREALGRSDAGEARRLVFSLDKSRPYDTLHALINWMHQAALEAFASEGCASPYRRSGDLVFDGEEASYAYVGREPFHEVLRRNRGLRRLIRNLPAVPGFGEDEFFFDEERAWIHADLGCHSAEIFADFNEPDDGGMLRVRFQESGVEHGSEYRLAAIGAFLEKLGMSVEIDGDRFLAAIWDKDRGLDSSRALSEALPRVLVFLHGTLDLDLFMEYLYEDEGYSDARVRKFARRLADIHEAEGGWPRDFSSYNPGILRAFQEYDGLGPERDGLREALDSELVRLGLDPLPEGILIGQLSAGRFFTEAVENAAARGQISWDGRTPPRPKPYSPVQDLVKMASAGGGEGMAAASVLDSVPGALAFEPIGLAGGFRAERAQERLSDGSILTVHALRDLSSGRLAWAKAEGLDAASLRARLYSEGFDAGEGDGFNEPQKRRLEKALLKPLGAGVPGEARAFGLPSSPGLGLGPISFDRERAPEGSILAVPYTSPDDVEAISRSAGVLTTGGGSLSHAAITTRELGLPSAVLPSAGWRKEGGKAVLAARLSRQGPAMRAPEGVEWAELKAVAEPLREGDLVRIDGGTGEVVLVSRDKNDPLRRAYEALEGLRSGRLKVLKWRKGWTGETARFLIEEALYDPRYARCRDKVLKAASKHAPVPSARAAGAPHELAAGKPLPAAAGLKPSLLGLSEIDDSWTPLVGGKAAKLGELSAALRGTDASVPGGVALTVFAYERFLEENGLAAKVAELAAALDAGGDAERLSEEIRAAILSGRLDPGKGVGREIARAIGGSGAWAVRSSAVQEDSDEAAFAGAAESYLFVRPGEILEKVVENWASFWLPRGILYRRRLGVLNRDMRPATLLQGMVQADKSGVIFTRNPVDSSDEIVIDAVYGLGEGAVSGQAEADEYAARGTDGEEIALPRVAFKRLQVVSSGERSGTRAAPVPKALRQARVLGRGETRRLAKAAAAIEGRFGRAMDIEFSISEGKIFILQARPITTAGAR